MVQVYFGMLDALLAAEQLPDEYRNRDQVFIHFDLESLVFPCYLLEIWRNCIWDQLHTMHVFRLHIQFGTIVSVSLSVIQRSTGQVRLLLLNIIPDKCLSVCRKFCVTIASKKLRHLFTGCITNVADAARTIPVPFDALPWCLHLPLGACFGRKLASVVYLETRFILFLAGGLVKLPIRTFDCRRAAVQFVMTGSLFGHIWKHQFRD